MKQCLESIRSASNNLKVETIVVDNDSQDGSVELLEPIFPDVTFIASKENLGFGRANNLGFDISKGKYILILNPDTLLNEDTLDTMFKYMENNSHIGISGCKVLNGDGTFQLACRRGFPTPWAAFSKLFGLQKIFPNSKIFAQYNQTFRSVDETYYIDAVIGAFMFARADVIKVVNGFDPEFFMYGEDLDLCFRVQKAGYKIAYNHTTSIIHYKGESTKRSSINEVKHFYEAMEIFARKHFGKSAVLLKFLRLGIYVRAGVAYLNKFKHDLFYMATDVLSVNFSLLLATKIRTGAFLGLMDITYPFIFILFSFVLILSIFSVGGYFERKYGIAKAFYGLMVSFFILSSLTYLFKEFDYTSRGILLLTVGFTAILTAASRIVGLTIKRVFGKKSIRRIALVGQNNHTESLISELQRSNPEQLVIEGVVGTQISEDRVTSSNFLGSFENLEKIIQDNKINEIIITDNRISRSNIMNMLSKISNQNVRFHIAHEYEDLIFSRLISEITGAGPDIPQNKLMIPRFKFFKRTYDIVFSLIFLTLLSPLFLIKFGASKYAELFEVIIGKKSIIGIIGKDKEKNKEECRQGIFSLLDLSANYSNSEAAHANLNNYYLQNYNFYLDLEILFKILFRK